MNKIDPPNAVAAERALPRARAIVRAILPIPVLRVAPQVRPPVVALVENLADNYEQEYTLPEIKKYLIR